MFLEFKYLYFISGGMLLCSFLGNLFGVFLSCLNHHVLYIVLAKDRYICLEWSTRSYVHIDFKSKGIIGSYFDLM